jgi:hypothetical protein
MMYLTLTSPKKQTQSKPVLSAVEWANFKRARLSPVFAGWPGTYVKSLAVFPATIGSPAGLTTHLCRPSIQKNGDDSSA